ncbi:fluoride efflux transporter CrcB [Lacipirellula limnantheis]|uniref:Fluoride-specific ion channel FluC n=1 Tax=Lacipirellula limnantheis TaxID=2528024 RepID=A0A517TVM2_9BACT|nr:fluoride efflux transporter CrcB [Lacipirellula limnantheis]QDT72421.1 Putative fluoride ion transporter CrcB [Lacipirellula limnantheis]
MLQFFLVFIGSGIGGMARLALGSFAFSHTADWRFPLGTFLVNAIGCLAAGILAGLIERWGVLPAEARLFLFTGVLGGFTTFSAFSLETVALLRRGNAAVAASYVALSIFCGLLAIWAGMLLINRSA